MEIAAGGYAALSFNNIKYIIMNCSIFHEGLSVQDAKQEIIKRLDEACKDVTLSNRNEGCWFEEVHARYFILEKLLKQAKEEWDKLKKN